MMPIKTSYLAHMVKEWSIIASGIYNWYHYFTYPSERFEMINLPTYAGDGYQKTQLNIKEIIGIGIANASRYEHYRMHLGGEYGSIYGKIEKPEDWQYYFASSLDPENLFDGVDGHGYVDGTCNFFMLAKIGMKVPGETGYTDRYAVLWIDEQEYFSERWHVFHPRDNAFEGLPATFISAFPCLTWFNGINMSDFESTFGTPYSNLTCNARMTTSGTATIVADNDRIYSGSFFWAVTDATWRTREYPSLLPGESIDKTSLKIRDDMTIYFKGAKKVDGAPVKGYWYQKYLPPDNSKPGVLRVGGMPTEGYTHPWSFAAQDAFEYMNAHCYKTGVYETSVPALTDPSQHYGYKGYKPHTHVFKFKGPIVASNGTSYSPSAFFSNHFDSENCYVLLKDATGQKVMTHPMYKDMDANFTKSLTITFQNVSYDGGIYATYSNIRNEDIKLLTSVGVWLYIRPLHGGSVYTIKTTDIEDLDVWADAPINQIDITHNSGTSTFGFRFTLLNPERYLLTSLKVGYIKNGLPTILTTVPLAPPTSGVYTSLNNYISQSNWETFLSDKGRALYGTSVWVEDAFGNGNSILNLASVGIPAPVLAADASTSNGMVRDKPAVAGQPVTFLWETTGVLNTIKWNFGDGTPVLTSLPAPVHRYKTPGTYTVTVTAVGPDFSSVVTFPVTVIPNIMPVINQLLK
jgi:hypothetical protein